MPSFQPPPHAEREIRVIAINKSLTFFFIKSSHKKILVVRLYSMVMEREGMIFLTIGSLGMIRVMQFDKVREGGGIVGRSCKKNRNRTILIIRRLLQNRCRGRFYLRLLNVLLYQLFPVVLSRHPSVLPVPLR